MKTCEEGETVAKRGNPARRGDNGNEKGSMDAVNNTIQATQAGTASAVPERIAQEYLAAGLSVFMNLIGIY